MVLMVLATIPLALLVAVPFRSRILRTPEWRAADAQTLGSPAEHCRWAAFTERASGDSWSLQRAADGTIQAKTANDSTELRLRLPMGAPHVLNGHVMRSEERARVLVRTHATADYDTPGLTVWTDKNCLTATQWCNTSPTELVPAGVAAGQQPARVPGLDRRPLLWLACEAVLLLACVGVAVGAPLAFDVLDVVWRLTGRAPLAAPWGFEFTFAAWAARRLLQRRGRLCGRWTYVVPALALPMAVSAVAAQMQAIAVIDAADYCGLAGDSSRLQSLCGVHDAAGWGCVATTAHEGQCEQPPPVTAFCVYVKGDVGDVDVDALRGALRAMAWLNILAVGMLCATSIHLDSARAMAADAHSAELAAQLVASLPQAATAVVACGHCGAAAQVPDGVVTYSCPACDTRLSLSGAEKGGGATVVPSSVELPPL